MYLNLHLEVRANRRSGNSEALSGPPELVRSGKSVNLDFRSSLQQAVQAPGLASRHGGDSGSACLRQSEPLLAPNHLRTHRN